MIKALKRWQKIIGFYSVTSDIVDHLVRRESWSWIAVQFVSSMWDICYVLKHGRGICSHFQRRWNWSSLAWLVPLRCQQSWPHGFNKVRFLLLIWRWLYRSEKFQFKAEKLKLKKLIFLENSRSIRNGCKFLYVMREFKFYLCSDRKIYLYRSFFYITTLKLLKSNW